MLFSFRPFFLFLQVSLSYLKSYRGMGTADVACVSGCTCEPQLLDATWETEVSLQQILQFWVSQATLAAQLELPAGPS